MDKLTPLIKVEKLGQEAFDGLRGPSNDHKMTVNKMEVEDPELDELHHSIDIKEEDDGNLEYQDYSNEGTPWYSNNHFEIKTKEIELNLEDSQHHSGNIRGETSVHLRKTKSSGNKKRFKKCDLCDYKSTHKGSLNRHLKTHTGEKPFKCQVCEYKCALKRNLIDHLKTHTGEKPFNCEICDYKCARNGHLKDHLKTHTGERPFHCQICDYKCARKGTLKEHLKTHTGIKSFHCEICDYKCAQKRTLNDHLKSHTNEN